MSTISNLGDAYHWSVAKIAEAFGLNRSTVKKRLLDANTTIAATVRGNPVYALKDIGPILFAADAPAGPERQHDPSTMSPKDRKDWFQSENELPGTMRIFTPVTAIWWAILSAHQ